jgi:hypothetical protein
MNFKLVGLFFVFAGLTCRTIMAECPGLERLVKPIASEMKPAFSGEKVVVACRQVGKQSIDWAIHESLAFELAEALKGLGVDVVPAAFDHRIETIGLRRAEFTPSDVRWLKGTEYTALIAATLTVSKSPRLTIAVYSSNGGPPRWTKAIDVPLEVLSLAGNVPEANRKMVDFCRENFDKKVGSGICAQLASVGLSSIGAKRFGVYTWGREVDDQEPILPGDVLQLELVKMTSPGFSRGFHHHTAVVEDVTRDSISVFHQNVNPKGLIVQRDTWPRKSFQSGTIIAYRPRSEASVLPPVSPKRRTPARVIRRGTSIDLMTTVDPQLDSVKGIWFIEENTLRPNRDDYARLQIPCSVPEKYTIRLKIERLFGSDMFGVGVIVGGQQTMVCMDGYGGTYSGLHLVDGKKAKSNSTTFKGPLLPENQVVSVRIHVEPNAVTAEADGSPFLTWRGNPSQLSVDGNYAVPQVDQLFLASWNTQFAISELLLDEEK